MRNAPSIFFPRPRRRRPKPRPRDLARPDILYATATLSAELPPGEAIRTIEELMKTGVWCVEFFALPACQPILREVSEPFDSCLFALRARSDDLDRAIRFSQTTMPKTSSAAARALHRSLSVV